MEHAAVVRQGDMHVGAQLEERRDQRGGDIGQAAGLGVIRLAMLPMPAGR
jgi:hypothetical protein